MVTQILLEHSKIAAKYSYNVFTAGIGIFDMSYQNPNKDDKRKLRQSSNNELIEFIQKYYGETIRSKSIEIFDLNA